MTFLILLNGGVVLRKSGASLPQMLAYATRTFGHNLREVRALRSQWVAA
jgi:hypothetical protein